MAASKQIVSPMTAAPGAGESAETRFVNGLRLGVRHWLSVFGVVLLVVLLVPRLWERIERFQTGTDYRIPYNLSKDYWLYERRLHQLPKAGVVVVGDSVVWGEYVLSDGTLSHYLNEQKRPPANFVNGGVNGLFPLALEGLVRYYGAPLHDRKIILHCNVLWMSSPKADLRTEKEETFNHSRLVPQFTPRIPCYKADINERLTAILERSFRFLEWANHLQIAYFGQRNILNWTLEDNGRDPPGYPNSYKNPLSQITLVVPGPPANDPLRGPKSSRHKPWFADGARPTRFEWVDLESSLQWHAFQRLLETLRDRRNEVFVVLGPFNEHMLTEENHAAYSKLRGGIAGWLARNRIPHLVPEALPSELYADASHPLTAGYELLAKRMLENTAFQAWLKEP